MKRLLAFATVLLAAAAAFASSQGVATQCTGLQINLEQAKESKMDKNKCATYSDVTVTIDGKKYSMTYDEFEKRITAK